MAARILRGSIGHGLLLAALLIAASPSRAEPGKVLYHYTDRNGTEVVVDDMSRVPPEYRGRAKALHVGDRAESEIRPGQAGPAPREPDLNYLQAFLVYLAIRALVDAVPVWLAARVTRLDLTFAS